jgi:hypothetical protein
LKYIGIILSRDDDDLLTNENQVEKSRMKWSIIVHGFIIGLQKFSRKHLDIYTCSKQDWKKRTEEQWKKMIFIKGRKK